MTRKKEWAIGHHIWCNYAGSCPTETCTQCIGLKERYPEDECSPEALVAKHFPDAIIRGAPVEHTHTVDQFGWIKTDEKLPANLENVLIWNDESGIQIVQFNMYSSKRYEFIDIASGDTISIYQVRFWQSLPKAPTDSEIV